jgi:hypothetical protein
MMNHRAPVNLHDVDLNLVLMVVMKVCLNPDAQDGQMNQQSLDVMKVDPMMDDQMMTRQMKDGRLMIHQMKDGRLMDDQKMIHQMKDDRLMDDQNYLVDLNFRDVLPCAYSLISIEI